MIITPTTASAARCAGSGRYAWSTTTGSPNSASVSAWPAPQASPSRPARRVPSSGSDAISVETAARWSGSDAWRSPSSSATSRTSASPSPCASSAIRSSSPNTAVPSLGAEARGGHGELPIRDAAVVRRQQLRDQHAQTVRVRAASASGASSVRFWNTPPDSTTVSIPARADATRHAVAVAAASALWKRADTAGTGTSRSRSLAIARIVRTRVEHERPALRAERQWVGAGLGRVGHCLELDGGLTLVVHLGPHARRARQQRRRAGRRSW